MSLLKACRAILSMGLVGLIFTPLYAQNSVDSQDLDNVNALKTIEIRAKIHEPQVVFILERAQSDAQFDPPMKPFLEKSLEDFLSELSDPSLTDGQ